MLDLPAPGPVPEEELLLLAEAYRGAEECAADGVPADGHRALLAGAERARDLIDHGAPWAEALVARWRDAAALFAARHGMGEP